MEDDCWSLVIVVVSFDVEVDSTTLLLPNAKGLCGPKALPKVEWVDPRMDNSVDVVSFVLAEEGVASIDAVGVSVVVLMLPKELPVVSGDGADEIPNVGLLGAPNNSEPEVESDRDAPLLLAPNVKEVEPDEISGASLLDSPPEIGLDTDLAGSKVPISF